MSQKLTRRLNAVDFWRGVALVMIFINHIPGTWLSNVTLRNYAINDAAEIFVFLAGYAISYASGRPGTLPAPLPTAQRFWGRAFVLYRAHVLITVLALALLAGAALLFERPILLSWHNAGPAFLQTPEAVVGGALLTYQLGYFNILPLYIVLLLATPFVVGLGRFDLRLLIVVSAAIWLFALTTRTTLPSWPAPRVWFFNPLAWQVYLVSGFVVAELLRGGAAAATQDWIGRLWWPAAAVAAAAAAVVLFKWWPDPLRVPEPKLLFLFNKTHASPSRLINLLALAILVAPFFPRIVALSEHVAAWFCQLGRNSLGVFCVGSLLSLTGQILRFLTGGDALLDLVFIVFGILVMGLTAWVAEQDFKSPPSSRAPSAAPAPVSESPPTAQRSASS